MASPSTTTTITRPAPDRILVTRELDAPPHLVFKAWTTPELVRRWWPGRQGEMTVAEIDLRVGGRWRYAMAVEDGAEAAFHGVFREIVPGERIVTTEVYEEMPDGEVVTTTTFTEVDGRTRLEQLIDCGSRETADALLELGMEGGVREQLELVEQVAQSLA
jgi:uncharacterized protein YndB with AHSA1/START domain